MRRWRISVGWRWAWGEEVHPFCGDRFILLGPITLKRQLSYADLKRAR